MRPVQRERIKANGAKSEGTSGEREKLSERETKWRASLILSEREGLGGGLRSRSLSSFGDGERHFADS